MEISFRCPACQSKLAIDASAAGQEVRCPACNTSVTVPQARLGPGVTIGGFKIDRLIGTGGMGEVYLARQLSMDRMVALKILAGHARSEEDKQRFIQEVRTLARLEHPNIVTAHEAGEDGGYLYLAMSYVNGEALDRRLAAHGRIPEREALKIVRKIARALEYAWTEHRLLHRDIKPGNILVDAHGEPKLADLGLAHSVQTAGAVDAKPRVAGTPNYMSPEQAEGRDDLDCRSDIYALGATLYHMLTGQLPYAADTQEETLRRKFEEPLPDPRSLNPQISANVVALLGGMLARDRAERYSTWKELLTDMDRCLAGKPPVHSALPAEPTNRLRLTAAELSALRDSGAQRRRRTPGETAAMIAITVVALLIVAAFASFVVRHVHSPLTPPVAPSTPAPPLEERPQKMDALESQYKELIAQQERHAASPKEGLQIWNAFHREAEGTEFAKLAMTQIAALRKRMTEEIRRAVEELRQSVTPLVEAGDFDGARRLLEEYDGPWARETEAARKQEIERIRKLEEEAEARRAQAAQDTMERAHREAARQLVRLNPAAALAAFDEGCREAQMDPSAPELVAFRNILLAAQRMRELVLDAFRVDAGRTIEIQFNGGSEHWEITGVNGSAVAARRKVGGGYVERSFSYAELAPSEKFRRLERVPSPANRILQALLLIEANNLPMARKQLEAVASDEVARRMLMALDTELQAAAESTAQRALATLLRRLNIPEGLPPTEIAARIRRTAFPAADLANIRAAAAEFRRIHGTTRHAAEMEDVLRAIEKVNTYPREVEPAVLDRAREGLRRANPSLTAPPDALLRPVPDGLELVLDGAAGPQVTSLAPLAGLPLVRVTATAPGWRDLSVLRGLPIQELELRGARLETYDGLRALPLRRLALIRCAIDSLTIVSGLQIESLDVSENRISNLAPLAGMPLKRLAVRQNSHLASLRPLTGMALEELALDGCARVDDLKPLRGMPLTKLSIADTAVTDLSPLSDSPIESLNIAACPGVKDLTPLKALPLKELNISGNPMASLAPLAGLRLQSLIANGLQEVNSLSPLRGMPLETLSVRACAVDDLSPLRGAPLRHLTIGRTRVVDLSPLADLPLTYLDLAGALHVRDLALLARCRTLTSLVVPSESSRWRAAVSTIPSLKYVGYSAENLMPIEEFFRAEPPASRGPTPVPDPPAGERPPSPGR